MADEKMDIWSWNEAYPGFDIENATGIPRGELEKIFGEYDIKIQVPDKNSFLNETEMADNPKKFESERKVLTQFLNSLRSQMNITERPFNSYSEEELDQIQLKQRYLNEVKQEQALASDPMKVMNANWRQKLDEDKRNFHTFITGKGRTEGFEGPGEGLYGTVKGMYKSDWDEDAWKQFADYFGDSFMGLANTTMRVIPENNKQNWAIAGELMGNLPLYFLDKKKLANAWLNPRKNPTDMGKVTASAGVGGYTAATAYDGLNDVIRQLKGLPDPELSEDPRVENLVHGRNALIFTGGAASLDPVFQGMKGLARWTYGVTRGSDAAALAKIAIEQNIPMGIMNVTDRSWAKWYGRVLGVFPFVGTPLRASKARVAWYLDQRIMDTFNALAPMSSVMDIGALITQSARTKFNQFARINAKFYDDFYSKANALDDMVGADRGYIPTFRVKELAKNWQEQMKRQKVEGQGYVGEGVPREVGGISDAADFEKFLMFLGTVDDHLSANQFRGLQKKFNEAWRNYSKTYGPEAGDTIASDANKFKMALEQGLNDTKMWKLPTGPDGKPIAGAAEMMEQVIGSLNRANHYFGEMANTYKSPVAKRFSLVDEKMFIPGALEQPGWTYGDQIAKDLFSTFFENPSKEALQDLSKIVKRNLKNPSEDPINRAARGYLQELFEGSADQVAYNMKSGQFKINVGGGGELGVWSSGKDVVNINIFNPKRFADSLKVGTKDGDEFLTEMWKQTLKANGKTLSAKEAKDGLENMRQLLVLAQRGYDTKIAETAQFVARRATLAGVSGITGAFLATSAGVSPLTGVGMALLARHQSKVLSSPETLKWLVTTIDDTVSDKIRRANYVRLARVIFDEEPEIPEGLDIKDPNDVLNYLLGRNFGITGEDQSGVPPPERKPEGVKKTFEPIKAPLIPRANVETGPVEAGGLDQWKEQQQSNNVSAEVKSRMASNYVRRPGGPTRGKLNPNQREALAGGNLYSAIAAAKHGGAVYNDGIMNLANRRRV